MNKMFKNIENGNQRQVKEKRKYKAIRVISAFWVFLFLKIQNIKIR